VRALARTFAPSESADSQRDSQAFPATTGFGVIALDILSFQNIWRSTLDSRHMADFRHSFQYYALRYLLLWEQAERVIFERLSATNTTDALRKAMHHFRISRSFSGIADDARATLIIRATEDANSRNPAENVQALAQRFKDDFKSFNLSAASKLLWWKHKSPYVIYDSQAVVTLRNSVSNLSTATTQPMKKHGGPLMTATRTKLILLLHPL
jgi:hypothetical protein